MPQAAEVPELELVEEVLDSHANTVTTPHLEECNSNK